RVGRGGADAAARAAGRARRGHGAGRGPGRRRGGPRPGRRLHAREGDRLMDRAPLSRPDGTDPEGFSRRVAEAYNEAIPTTSKPAVALAEEAGVPVVTVHRWIREAR